MEKEEMIPVRLCCIHYEVDMTFIRSLQDAGLVSLTTLEDENYLPGEELGNLEKFIRLHQDLQINTGGLEVIADMLEKMEALQQENTYLKNRLEIYEL